MNAHLQFNVHNASIHPEIYEFWSLYTSQT